MQREHTLNTALNTAQLCRENLAGEGGGGGGKTGKGGGLLHESARSQLCCVGV